MIRACALLAVLSAPLAARAEVLDLPQGCAPIASVQHRTCMVTLYWQCEGVSGYSTADADADGLVWFTDRDAGGQWTRMRYARGLYRMKAVDVQDASDHRQVLSEGADSYRYSMMSPSDQRLETYVGNNTLSGPAMIGAEPVQAVDYDYIVTDRDGVTLRAMTGTAYLWGEVPISIPGAWQSADGTRRNAAPVDILTEGEPGFMDITPIHDCGEVIS